MDDNKTLQMPRDCWTCRHNLASPRPNQQNQCFAPIDGEGRLISWLLTVVGDADMPPKNGAHPDCPAWQGTTAQALTA